MPLLPSDRLPHSNRTYFQCDVAICRGECEKPQCGADANVVRAGGGPLASLNAGALGGDDGESTSALKTIDDPFARPEDDAVTTSTSVFVAQPGTEESGTAGFPILGIIHYQGWHGYPDRSYFCDRSFS